MTQEELLPLLLKKDDRSFTLLYDNYSKSLYGIIFNLIKDKEEAEDVLQEVFVKVWKNIDSYSESKGRFYTWMLNIARNAAIDTTRSKGYQKSQQNQSLTENVYDLAGSTKIKSDDIGLRKAVHGLRPEWRVLIELAYFEGYTQDEISKMLDIPLGTVKTRLRAALKELHKLIKE